MVPGDVDTMGGLGTERLKRKNLLVKRAKTKEKREKKISHFF